MVSTMQHKISTPSFLLLMSGAQIQTIRPCLQFLSIFPGTKRKRPSIVNVMLMPGAHFFKNILVLCRSLFLYLRLNRISVLVLRGCHLFLPRKALMMNLKIFWILLGRNARKKKQLKNYSKDSGRWGLPRWTCWWQFWMRAMPNYFTSTRLSIKTHLLLYWQHFSIAYGQIMMAVKQ